MHDLQLANRGLVPSLAFAAFLPIFSILIVSAALPTILSEFSLTGSVSGFLITANLLGLALGYIIGGLASDKWGRRFTLVFSLTVFAFVSFFAAWLQSFHGFLAARALQALSGGGALVVIGPLFHDLYSHNVVAAARGNVTVATATAFGPILGIPTGAALQAYGSWRYGFIIVAVLGVAAIALVKKNVPDTRSLRVAPGYSTTTPSEHLRNSRLIAFACVGAASLSVVYAFMTAAPFLVMKQWRHSPEIFGAVSMVPPLGMLLAGVSTRFWVQKHPSSFAKLAFAAGLCQAIAAFGLCAAVWTGSLSMVIFFAVGTICAVGNGVLLGFSVTFSLAQARAHVGAAGAAVGFLQMVGAAVGSAISSGAGNATAAHLSVWLATAGGANLALLYFLLGLTSVDAEGSSRAD